MDMEKTQLTTCQLCPWFSINDGELENFKAHWASAYEVKEEGQVFYGFSYSLD